MRRLAIILVGGALWLLLFAIPALADGGPHVMTKNNGSGGISADACASCHRIHTSKSPTGFLLVSNESTVTNYCRSCHGAVGTGASTDVDTGIQYAVGTNARNGGTIGALRGGGFVQARIGSDMAYRLVGAGSTSGYNPKVPVTATPGDVTSSHIAIAAGVTAKNIVWGNGTLGAPGAGPTLASEMECTACHNPHGNGNYRILNSAPDPGAVATGSTAFAVNTPAAPVTDASTDYTRTRNYSVIQVKGTIGNPASFLLYADQVLGTYNPLSGDYFHKNVPFDANGVQQYDGPNGLPNTSAAATATTGFNVQMTNWCSQCHSRYLAASGARSPQLAPPAAQTGGGVDSIFSYRHTTAQNRTCTTCHVAHGTNAVMDTDKSTTTPDGASANVPYPDNSTTVGDSRLLKVDNRGTCQLCHDPTSGSALPSTVTAHAITAISIANPTEITTADPHGLVSGDTVAFSRFTTTNPISGVYVVTVTGSNTFTIPVNVTVPPASYTGATVMKTVAQGTTPVYVP